MKDIVRYNNDMNSISFGGFKEKELDLFFSICFKLKEMGTNTVSIDFSELKKLSNYTNRNLDRFIKDLSSTYDKMLSLKMVEKHSELSFTKFNLFNEYTVNAEKRIITIKVNEKFKHILNNLFEKYTKFELESFVNLKSSYSKNIFKILKQWEGTTSPVKTKTFSLDEFKTLLGISGKYEKISALDTYVLGQLRKELPKYFKNLNIEKKKTGRTVTAIEFTWIVETEKIELVDDIEILISQTLEKAFEKASHNRYINPHLTDDNKAILIEAFEDEKALAKGLYFAYKNINNEFSKLSYLIQVIKSGIIHQNKVIKVEDKKENSLNEDDYVQKSFNDIILKPLEEQKKIDNNKIDNDLDVFEKLSEMEKAKIEKTALELFVKENGEQGNYIATMKKTSPTLYYNSLRKYILQIMNKKEVPIKEKIEVKEEKKVYTADDIPADKLLGKNGKKLTGGALKMRIKKILDEMNKKDK